LGSATISCHPPTNFIKTMSVPHTMSRESRLFGETTLFRHTEPAEYGDVLRGVFRNSGTVIIKPNWVSNEEGAFTTVESLRGVIEALPGKVIVVEAHQTARVLGDPDLPRFEVNGVEVDWTWFRGQGWLWLKSHPNWGWFRNQGMLQLLRKADRRFIERFGFADLFRETGTEYLNITEEVWGGRFVDPIIIKGRVESRFPPAFTDALYGIVPERLYRLKGATLVSLTRLKEYASFTLKNLFGLIPDPNRSWWHGAGDKRLHQSVMGATEVYASLFNLYGVWEYGGRTRLRNNEGKLGGPDFRYDLVEGRGILAHSPNLVELDAILGRLNGFEVKEMPHIVLAEGVFGSPDNRLPELAVKDVGEWFRPSRSALGL